MKNNIPKHIAIIMDGNRRWAKRHKLAEFEGHSRGIEALIETVEAAGSMGVKYLTVYALSSENFLNRAKGEITNLLHLLEEGYTKHLPRLKKEGIKLNFFGDIDELPKSTQALVNQAKKELSTGERGVLSVALNYGGRDEILSAAEQVSQKGANFSEINFRKELYTAQIPDPDLLIRTGGQKRLSNFLLWQLSYTELYFTDILWPDFSKKDLEEAVDYFKSTKRNLGS